MEKANSPLYAVVDLGSNSFHLLVVRSVQGSVQILAKVKQKVRLAAGLDHQDILSDEAMHRGWQCLATFAERLQVLPSKNIKIVATAAIRRAKNADVFIDKAQSILGCPIEVISGEQEASYIFQGAMQHATHQGCCLAVDIGGASTEIIIGEKTPAFLHSFDVGCVTWMRRFFQNHLSDETFEQAIRAAKTEFQPFLKNYQNLDWQFAIGASGTIQALMEVFAAQQLSSDITLEKLLQLKLSCIACHTPHALQVHGLSSERAAVFPSGLAILIAIFELFEIPKMTLAGGALREGLIACFVPGLHPPKTQTIQSFQQNFHIDLAQANRVSKIAKEMYGQCRPSPSAESLLLLETAAQLHEIGLCIHYKKRNHHGAYLLKHLPMPGFDQNQQKIIRDLVENHCDKLKICSHSTVIAEDEYRLLLQLLRLAVILCHQRHGDGLKCSCQYQNNQLKLQLPITSDHHPLLWQMLHEEKAHQASHNLHFNFN